MAELKELIRLVENFYAVERVVNALEKEPRFYNTEQLLYANEVHTLKFIAQSEGMTQKELTERMYRTKGATSTMLNKLERKGLVIRKEDEKDARLIRLYLTDEGRKVNACHIQYDEEKAMEWKETLGIDDEKMDFANQVIEQFVTCISKKELQS